MAFFCYGFRDAFIKAAVEVFISHWASLSHSNSQIFTGHSFWSSSNQAFGGNVIMLLGWNEALKLRSETGFKSSILLPWSLMVLCISQGFKSLNTKLRKKKNQSQILFWWLQKRLHISPLSKHLWSSKTKTETTDVLSGSWTTRSRLCTSKAFVKPWRDQEVREVGRKHPKRRRTSTLIGWFCWMGR